MPDWCVKGPHGSHMSPQKGLTCARARHLEFVYVQPQYARARASAHPLGALPLRPALRLGECK